MEKREGLITVVFFIVFIGLALLTLWVIKPYIQAILAAMVLAYVFHPVYTWLVSKTGQRTLSALLICVVIIAIFFVPMAFAIDSAAGEARFVYLRTLQVLKTGNFMDGPCAPADSTICVMFEKVGGFFSSPEVQLYAQDALGKATTFIITTVTNLLLALPSIIVNVLITIFAVFYLLKDGPMMVKRFQTLLPVSKKHQAHIIKKLGETTHALVYGSLIIALLQGILGGIGLWVVGVHSPILWGAVMAVFALIPVGTGIVWGPVSVYMILAGISQGDAFMTYKGVGLLLYGIFIVSTIDNILKPKIIGNRTGIHPVLVLVGVLGGLAAFGPVGFVIGPLVIALLKSIIDIYETETRHI
jgi:predicted PurR-regulated permease PerM